MKRYFKKFLGLLLILVFTFTFLTFSVGATDTTVTPNSNNVSVGNTVEVTIQITGDQLLGTQLTIFYDQDILTYSSGADGGGAGQLTIFDVSPTFANSVSYTITFTTIKTGSARISVQGKKSNGDGSEVAISGGYADISVIDKVLSSNANLKSLSLGSSIKLSPSFSPSRTSYSVNVPNSVTECKVYATTADPNAKFTVQGSSTLKIGKNTRTVVVTAPNGTQKTYTINITRSETEQLPETDNPQDNETKLNVDVNGVTHTIQTDISSSKVFSGFSPVTEQFNEQDVTVLKDNNDFKIYYLKAQDSEEFIPFVYNEKEKIFEKLVYITQNNIDYIISKVPEDLTLPDDYFETNITLGENNIKCYANHDSDLADFVYIYCYKDGKYGFYRFDKLENVLQRYPELELVEIKTDANVENDTKDNFLTRISLLTTNAKIILFGLIALILLAITLTVLIIIKLFKNKNEESDFDFEDDLSFDNENIVSDTLDTEDEEDTFAEPDSITLDETTTE